MLRCSYIVYSFCNYKVYFVTIVTILLLIVTVRTDILCIAQNKNPLQAPHVVSQPLAATYARPPGGVKPRHFDNFMPLADARSACCSLWNQFHSAKKLPPALAQSDIIQGSLESCQQNPSSSEQRRLFRRRN